MGIKNKLREIRMKEFAMDSGMFAKELGVNLKTYSNWETNRSKPPLEEALRISKLLNRTVNEIWDID
ncbi:helix-turn-helix domain-containing protein [Clostridium perfringens]|uniref:helix-turn-helix transcriptional regulator n=1 Tax=Clostridium perfringens TaxID=1502 RepID=UPI001A35FF48|nr:helix-turn-helix domain-containing protein [Clostridium perfringens]MDK0576501.1 helix-turn-helix domain-containing protein [Clostridium perfringens]MDK0579444.1 helix-turn-helix domain-containing protein [Clostridium perfringens]MDM0661808.1 helix-turn-helix domain-containing protein [Clostridium perfringens]UYC94146.1 helix-turn-helix domain-containing protein [Clostridium perfringens]HAT4137832.1 helix-turn-helix domain-containing protein [Clostridium perfringens]